MKYIITFLISMIPLVELRGAVPLRHLKRNSSLASPPDRGRWQSCFLFLLFSFSLAISWTWGAEKPVIGNFFTWCLNKGHRGGQKLEKAAGDKGIFWALLLFVGIPLPGTWCLDWNPRRLYSRLGLQTQCPRSYARSDPSWSHHGNPVPLLGVDTFAH